ncbi:hypothetical protein [Klebsiella oxytoca]|uniref:hypothetical protein n=1 Tax=Klebsiella oxytoca TaxID=571 RepID=UPI0007DACE20|nr:hypothetical protein [Klebsiella oxytoca]ELG4821748.1 hypothetical protein [Klebsiella oxytoca]ELK5564966.1 hypothetical protein [Klebsiella oxytoca]ELK5575433.1 hypothetical protein [Klebsiella oxytoca]ELM1667114.1 hypothetical protein [Klebsiella oxytoca]MCW9550719.1 hypothetical protein [Klebsiella oxytoca]
MSETTMPKYTAARITRPLLASYLYQSLEQVCKLASGLKILQLPANDTARTATVLTEPVYAAAGLRLARQQPLAQNPLCDDVLRRFRHAPALTANLPDLIETVRSVALPVWSRLRRDGHCDDIAVRQTLLHILAWRSKSPWLQNQAQRILWQGGVLGERGDRVLASLDDEAAHRCIGFCGLSELLTTTGFLVHFPAGPLFSDENSESH